MSQWLVLLAAVATSANLAEAGMAGRAMYQFGIADPPVLMSLPGEASFTGSAPMACAACHGANGSGNLERTAVPDLERVAATASDPALFARVLGQGIASDGHPLRLMPRYAMSAGQRADLTAYLKALAAGNPPEPGLQDNDIFIDIAAMAPGARVELLEFSAKHPEEIYGRRLRFGADPQGNSFARIAAATPQANGPKDPPVVPIASTAPGAGRAAGLLVAELLRRTGRRLTCPAFAQALDELRKQEIEQ